MLGIEREARTIDCGLRRYLTALGINSETHFDKHEIYSTMVRDVHNYPKR